MNRRFDTGDKGNPWLTVFQQLKQQLPRVGAKEFRADSSIFQDVQTLNPKMHVRQVIGCKGVEKFLIGDTNNSHRHTIVMKRFSNEIVDLGCEAWTTLSQNTTTQKGCSKPYHAVCVWIIEGRWLLLSTRCAKCSARAGTNPRCRDHSRGSKDLVKRELKLNHYNLGHQHLCHNQVLGLVH